MDCTSISDKQELEKAVAEIGDWETLCENLGVPKSVINGLRYSNKQTTRKKSDCLEAYLDTDEACWEKVVTVVAEHPFNNRRLAKRITDTYYGQDHSSIMKEGRNLIICVSVCVCLCMCMVHECMWICACVHECVCLCMRVCDGLVTLREH